MKKKLRMFLCAALAASMMATAPALVQAAEEKETTETTETTESNAVRQDLAGLKYDHSLELQYADQFSVDYYEGGYALITIVGAHCGVKSMVAGRPCALSTATHRCAYSLQEADLTCSSAVRGRSGRNCGG